MLVQCVHPTNDTTALSYTMRSLRVLARLMTNRFLHRQIREKGGAYGGGARYGSGIFSFYSYRYAHMKVWFLPILWFCVCFSAVCRDVVQYPCVWKPHTANTSPRHPLLFLSFCAILTIFLDNFYSFLYEYI